LFNFLSPFPSYHNMTMMMVKNSGHSQIEV